MLTLIKKKKNTGVAILISGRTRKVIRDKEGHCVCVLVAQSCLTLHDPMDYSPLGSSVHGILQARTLEVAIPFSRQTSQPRDRTQVSCIVGRFFTV